MPGRRSFLIGCGCVVTAPALAATGLPFAIGTLAPDAPVQVATDLVFRIEGWEPSIDSQSSDDDRMVIRINSSWRAAWR